MALVSRTNLRGAQAALKDWLSTRLSGADDLQVSGFEVPAASGFSNETLLFDASWRDGGSVRRERMVARLQADGPGLYPVYDVASQFAVMRTLERYSDVAIPRMLWIEHDPSVLGVPFFVMERLAGSVPADDPPFTATGWVLDLAPEDRARLADNGLQELVKLHALRIDDLRLEFLERPDLGDTPLDQELAFYRNYYRWAAEGEPHPVIESAFAWLSSNRPTEHGPVVLSWGDARIGNMMFADDLSVVGVFDWEMASLARPEQDLGWWLFMHRHHTEGFGVPHPQGFPTREQVIARYQELAGREVANIEYYEALAALRGSVILLRLARMMIDAGRIPADSGMAHNNGASRILADLLGLPAPEGAGVALISKR
jgi:aminoglycoside phosphotransferase (APT) family kinase protein